MSRFHLFFRASAAAPAATFLASSNDRLFFVRSSPEAVPAMSIVDRIKAPIPPNFLSVAIICPPPRRIRNGIIIPDTGDGHPRGSRPRRASLRPAETPRAVSAAFRRLLLRRCCRGKPHVQQERFQRGWSFHECKSYSELGGNRCNRVRCCDSFDWWSSIVWQFGIACRFRQRGPLCALVQFPRRLCLHRSRGGPSAVQALGRLYLTVRCGFPNPRFCGIWRL